MVVTTTQFDERVLVWDAPVRVVHWLLVSCFAAAWLTAENEAWHLVHVTAGYTMAGLVAFRLLWGVVGTRHARFSQFVRGPRAALSYLRSTAGAHPDVHVGHNPAGGLAILGLLGLVVLTAASGWATEAELAGHWLEEVHEALATALLVLVGLHVLAVLASSWLHRENLVAAMLHGRKRAPPRQGIRRPWRPLAAVVLAAVAGFWWLQWRSAAAGGWLAPAPGRAATGHHD